MERISVLLVDDNPTLLRIVGNFLRGGDGISIVAATAGGESALVQAQELRPQVILLGLGMRTLEGLESISRLRRILPEAGIVVLALLDTNSYRRAAMEAGADDFVSKAAISNDLLPAIHRVRQTRIVRGNQKI